MSQSVKKYHHSVHLPSKNYNAISVTNAAHLNGTTYVSTSSKHNPIMKFSINKDGGLNENPTTVREIGIKRTCAQGYGMIKVNPLDNYLYILSA